MKTFPQFRKRQTRRTAESGSMLIELLISIVVLTIGLGGLMVLLVSAMYTNNRAGKDTSSTMVAEHVLEQISAQPANAVALLQLTDCANNTWNINTVGATLGGGSGSNGGNGSNLTPTGVVDWTQSYAAVPVGYAMQYTACGAGGRQTTYDVRWNVITITNYSRMVVVSARPLGSATVGGLRFVFPANLRTIAGM
jgi:type II secretory pathway pseudopilin PulG